MFAGLGIKGMAMIVVVLFVGGIVFAGYRFVTNIQEENGLLKAANADLSTAVDLKTAEVNALNAGIAAMAAEQGALNTQLAAARETAVRRQRIFDDHDFTKLLNAKPGLVESRMVAATKRLFGDLEQASNN